MPAETAAEVKGPQPVQRPAKRRSPGASVSTEPVERFFLTRSGADGAHPALDHEIASESEALVESLKTGLSYYVISEYRAIPDVSGKMPQIRKEAVKR